MDMKIDLKDLKEGLTKFEFKENEENTLNVPDKLSFTPLKFKAVVEITKHGIEYFISLNTDVSGKLTCGRCLNRFEKNLKEKNIYRVKLEPDSRLSKQSREIHLTEEDINTLYLKDTILDTRALVREVVILSIPIKPLCKENCKGLCPKCGINLNVQKCKCSPVKFTPLSKLKTLTN